MHKTANVLNNMPKSVQRRAKALIHEIWMAETRADAVKAFDTFLETHQAKYPAASSPVGVVDVKSPGPNGIYVGGWAIDPSTPDPIEVHVYIDGVGTNLGPASNSEKVIEELDKL